MHDSMTPVGGHSSSRGLISESVAISLDSIGRRSGHLLRRGTKRAPPIKGRHQEEEEEAGRTGRASCLFGARFFFVLGSAFSRRAFVCASAWVAATVPSLELIYLPSML